jgi:hypothetical protein
MTRMKRMLTALALCLFVLAAPAQTVVENSLETRFQIDLLSRRAIVGLLTTVGDLANRASRPSVTTTKPLPQICTLITKLDLNDLAIFGFSMGGGEVACYLGKHKGERLTKAGFIAAIPPSSSKPRIIPRLRTELSSRESKKQLLPIDRPLY